MMSLCYQNIDLRNFMEDSSIINIKVIFNNEDLPMGTIKISAFNLENS